MAQIVLISGGSRSGKSRYAQLRAEHYDKPRLFIATCPRIDHEMNDRIEKHIKEREGKGWQTVEETVDISEAIASHKDTAVILIDCLTLWINNLMYSHTESSGELTEDTLSRLCNDILQKSRNSNGTIIFVTNEVGSGIVPESPQTRLYRDLVGRCNQIFAQHADEVVLVCCGIPLTLKSTDAIGRIE